MFPGAPLSMNGWQSGEEFFSVLHNGLADPRLTPATGGGLNAINTIGTSSTGGFVAPSSLESAWFDTSLESEIIRPRATVYAMSAPEMKVPSWDGDNRSSTLYGGFAGAWLDEAGTIDIETPRLKLVTLRARKLAVLVQCSNELLADGHSFEEQLGQAIVKAMSWFIDRALLVGNGANAPLGILNAPSLITVSKETAQTAATINFTNVSKMYAQAVAVVTQERDLDRASVDDAAVVAVVDGDRHRGCPHSGSE